MQRVSSIFAQLVNLVPRFLFAEAVEEHQADKHAKAMPAWSQFIALLYCQLSGARSLREVIGGLAASEGKLKYLGVAKPPAKSTLG